MIFKSRVTITIVAPRLNKSTSVRRDRPFVFVWIRGFVRPEKKTNAGIATYYLQERIVKYTETTVVATVYTKSRALAFNLAPFIRGTFGDFPFVNAVTEIDHGGWSRPTFQTSKTAIISAK